MRVSATSTDTPNTTNDTTKRPSTAKATAASTTKLAGRATPSR